MFVVHIPEIGREIVDQAVHETCPHLTWVLNWQETILGKVTWQFYHAGFGEFSIPLWQWGWVPIGAAVAIIDRRFHELGERHLSSL